MNHPRPRKWMATLALPMVLLLLLALGACSSSSSSDDDVTDEPEEEEVIDDDDDDNDETVTHLQYDPEKFVGSGSCATCHSDEYDGWKLSKHPYMLQEAQQDEAHPDIGQKFGGKNVIPDDEWANSAMAALGLEWEDIAFTIGGFWKQRYLVLVDADILTDPADPENIREALVASRDADIDYQASNIEVRRVRGPNAQWNTGLVAGEYLDGEVNSAGETVEPGWADWGGGPELSGGYFGDCVACHATGVNDEWDRDGRWVPDHTMAEGGVGCEACHGPGQDHMASNSSDDVVNFSGATNAEITEFCGSCHGRTMRITEDHPDFDAGHYLIDRRDPYAYLFGVTEELTLKISSYLYEGFDKTTGEPKGTTAESYMVFADADMVTEHPDVFSQGERFYEYNWKENPYFDVANVGTWRFHKDGSARSHRMQWQDLQHSAHTGVDQWSCLTCHDPHTGPTVRPTDEVECSMCHGNLDELNEIMTLNAHSAGGAWKDQHSHTFNPDGKGKFGDDGAGHLNQ